MKFFYNDRGQRIRKESFTNYSANGGPNILTDKTFYIRDAAGTPMAVYTSNFLNNNHKPVLKEHTVYGASRLGVYKRANAKANYELTDHLGNVRAVVSWSESEITKIGTDYYPFGMPMPLRNSLSDYRYAYQGQEKDPETGKEAFELRLWDARIGRWLTTDPKREFHSPYLGMGNNSMRIIDPDGGSGQDVILKGKNNSSLRIIAPGKDVTINVDKDFEGNKTIDLGLQSLQDLAIGCQLTATEGAGLVNGASGSALLNSVLFFDDTYGGYWYQFGGAEISYDFGFFASFSLDLEASVFLGIRKPNGEFGPKAFSGNYNLASGSVGLDSFLSADLFYQYSVGQHWTVHEVGVIISADAVPNGFNAFGSLGTGGTSLLNTEVPTRERSWSDIIGNHLIFNPLNPF